MNGDVIPRSDSKGNPSVPAGRRSFIVALAFPKEDNGEMKHFVIATLVVLVVLGIGYFVYTETAQAPTDSAIHTGTGVNPNASPYSYLNASGDTILVEAPVLNATLGKTFTVSGKARGPWYFEASFPVVVTDANGAVLAQVPAKANGDWMTNDFVPFSADVTLSNGYTGPATITLKKDNPSGEAQNEASVSYPVTIQ